VIISKKAALEIEFSAPELSPTVCFGDSKVHFESHGDIKTDTQVKQMVKQNIHNALRACNGKIYGSGGAARLLGMAPTTLSSRIRACGIVPAAYKQR
jgi:transcriptional regulator with GAF, ATPase, and Fis domain